MFINYLREEVQPADKTKPKVRVKIPITDQTFRDEPVTFVGALHTPFENCPQGLIPGQQLNIQLTFSQPDFAVWSPGSVTTEYMLKVEDVHLYMTIAQLNREVENN
jgi:hypothetical protein